MKKLTLKIITEIIEEELIDAEKAIPEGEFKEGYKMGILAILETLRDEAFV